MFGASKFTIQNKHDSSQMTILCLLLLTLFLSKVGLLVYYNAVEFGSAVKDGVLLGK